MLDPKYLDGLPDAMVELYSQIEDEILADMARRVGTYDYWIPAADWQYEKMIELGAMHDDIVEIIASKTGKSKKEVEKLMTDATGKALAGDADVYKKGGLKVPAGMTPEMRSIFNAGLKKTNGLFKNLTKTTANTATKQFENALDLAYGKIMSGAFDYNSAISSAVKGLSKSGVGAIKYPSGKIDSLEVAVRRATLTGVNQTALLMQDKLADEMGCDLVEVTAHGGARPEHAAWQGQIYSRSGKSRKYKDFRSATGYGSGAGLGGWNCRHSFFPYFDGSPRAYNKKMLDGYTAKNYEYNGVKMTEYEATQKQRQLERNIRAAKRENIAMKSAGLDPTDSAIKLSRAQAQQMDFLKQTGLKPQTSRTQVAGFGRAQAAQAKNLAQKSAAGLANIPPSAIMKVDKVPGPYEKFKFVDKTSYKEIRNVAGKISKADRDIIWDHATGYIQTGNSWAINAAMRSGTIPKLSRETQNTIQILQNIITKNQIDRPIMAIRYADSNYIKSVFGFDIGAMTPKEVAAKLQKDHVRDLIEEKSFVSVSLDAAKNVFTNKAYRIELEIPKGKNIYVSSNYQESEAIMRDGTQYILKSAWEENGKVILRVGVI